MIRITTFPAVTRQLTPANLQLMFIGLYSRLFRQHCLLSRLLKPVSSNNVFSLCVRRNSVTSQTASFGQGNQRTKVSPPIADLAAFRRYLEGHDTKPYGRGVKESRDLLVQTFTETFESVAQNHRLSRTHFNTTDFLFDVFSQVTSNLLQQLRSFDRSVNKSYFQWMTSFTANHVATLNNYDSGRSSAKSMLQDLSDSVEMFLADYFDGMLGRSELKTRTDQIVGDIVNCMEDFLSCLATEQRLEGEGLPSKSSGSKDMNTHEGWNTKLFPEERQQAWK